MTADESRQWSEKLENAKPERTGRVVLYGRDKTQLRKEVYARARGRCEVVTRGKRCGKAAAWRGRGKGDLYHIVHRSHGGSDSKSNTCWSCKACHNLRHPGPQWGAGSGEGQHASGPR